MRVSSPGEDATQEKRLEGGFQIQVDLKRWWEDSLLSWGICLIIPCLLPIAMRVLNSVKEATIDWETTSRIMRAKGYQSMEDYVDMVVDKTEHSDEN